MTSRNKTSNTVTRIILLSSLLLPLPLLTGCNNQPDTSEAISHVNRAETYAEQGQYRSALLEVKNAIQMEPDNVDHIVRLANLYLEIGAVKEASDLLAPWVDDHTDAVALTLARAYAEQGKHLSAMEALAKQTPGSPEEQLEAALIRAKALGGSGEVAEALALYQSLAQGNPSNVEAIAGVLKTHISLGQQAQAVSAADDWLAKHEQAPEVLYWKGVAQYRENQLEAASATLTDAVAVLPTSDVFLPIRRDVLTTLSRVLTEQGKITEAQVYNTILAKNIDTAAREQAEAAIAAIKEGKLEDAKSILRDMLKLNPDNEQISLMLGAISAGTGELDEGAQLLTENLDPETTPTQFIRAATMAQIDTGDREAALKTLRRAIEARPNDNELLAMHGILALSLPEHQDEGVASLSKAIGNEPDRVRLRLALARYYIGQEKPEQALAQLRMAFTSQPAEWTTTATYLNLLIQQGEQKEAAEIRDSLLNGYRDQPEALLLASLADAQLGNQAEAIQRLEELAKESPELQAPKVALASLYARSGNSENAVNMLIDAATITPDSIQPIQQAGQIYARDHSIAEVKTWLAETGEAHPELKWSTDTLRSLISIRQGELKEARALLSQWQDSDAAPVKRAMGQLLLAEAQSAARAGDWSTARAKAAEAITLEPENLGFALLPVGIAQMEGDLDEAFSALDGVEQSFGENAAIILARANLLRQQQGATPAYDYLLEQWQSSQDTGLMPSLLALAKSEAPESVDQLTDNWISKEPDSIAANLARAEWLMANKQEIVAANHYEQVISRQPGNVTALNNLAWLLREEQPDRALELAQRASELAPQNAAVLDTYGWVLHLSGKHAEARDAVEKALALAPGNPEIEDHLESIKKSL
ncbi:hypothetical protein BKP64_04680 [Marinobacter salinus]|uniref:Tetratricopeptide repeat-like domain-containing protein n=1 Tax=Marinobacter salinus TaxID=1874317 RepID=A0A1D9GJ22_9GAMM|nr:tetratricopeptide repeat protein [Marinobacter salinus]AOY87524.1 hypothetical protein BKP64_04680 [Marinobacter salinus]